MSAQAKPDAAPIAALGGGLGGFFSFQHFSHFLKIFEVFFDEKWFAGLLLILEFGASFVIVKLQLTRPTTQ
ncbi:MAG: hypothetical protein K8T91_23420 [Planctomycetes bacterium]|nr:hypothetical protein [Planctomycetota bacterium]